MVLTLIQNFTPSMPCWLLSPKVERFQLSRRPLKDGWTIGGVFFGRGALAQMLKNPTYIGRIKHKDAVYDVTNTALIENETIDQVQK